MLPIPTLDAKGFLTGGGSPEAVLDILPRDITIMGGNLNSPLFAEYKTFDLLKDPLFLAQNANITAHCAISLASHHMECIYPDCSVLILGWGRIGKSLAGLLKNIGADVTICARKAQDRAMAETFGYASMNFPVTHPEQFSIIFNTVPAMVMPDPPADTIKIDLASISGIGGSSVIKARGLPGKMAPVSTGHLIEQTILRLLASQEVSA